MAQTLFERHGGFAAVSRIVLTFYDKVLDSDRIGHFFEDVDMKRLIDHQTKFVSCLMGGPASFSDDRLRQSHARLGIADDDFDEMRLLLDEALAEHGVGERDRRTIMDEIEVRRSLIVGRVAA